MAIVPEPNISTTPNQPTTLEKPATPKKSVIPKKGKVKPPRKFKPLPKPEPWKWSMRIPAKLRTQIYDEFFAGDSFEATIFFPAGPGYKKLKLQKVAEAVFKDSALVNSYYTKLRWTVNKIDLSRRLLMTDLCLDQVIS